VIKKLKVITIYFEDEDFKKLKQLKDKLSWRDFVLTLIPKEVNVNNDGKG